MYAVVETGGKQYRVQAGDILTVEKLQGEIGAQLDLEKILFVSKPGQEQSQVWVGKPYVAQAKVTVQVLGQGRGEKIQIVKRNRRKGYRRAIGHRQFMTELLVTGLDNGTGETQSLEKADLDQKVKGFHSGLSPVGLARTPKTLGSRVRLAGGPQKAKAPQAEAKEKSASAASKKTTSKKASSTATTKKASAKTTAKKSSSSASTKKTASKTTAKKTTTKKS